MTTTTGLLSKNYSFEGSRGPHLCTTICEHKASAKIAEKKRRERKNERKGKAKAKEKKKKKEMNSL